MRPFTLHQPESLDETFSLLERYGDDDVHLLAGGTSLVLLMNLGLVEPTQVVALRRITDLRGIRQNSEGGLDVGALTTHRELELSPEVSGYCPALTATFSDVATVRIRNQGTLGGNLAHADPAQDPPPMLMALDAEVTLASRGGQRRVPLEAFFVGFLTTVMLPGEVLTAVHLPPLPDGTRAAYTKFLPRTHDDYATVSVAARLRLDGDGRCQEVRVALGGAAGTPVRARTVEDALRGEVPTDAHLAEAAALVLESVDPPDDARGSSRYKRRMARVWTERTLRQLRDGSDGARQ
jgi:aerobic carbon-monoxide dehydrogenase medium subunit